MLSSVLNSSRAIEANVAIMRAFVRSREAVSLQRELAGKFAEWEKRLDGHDEDIREIFDSIRRLVESPRLKPRKIGFRPAKASEGKMRAKRLLKRRPA